MRGARRWALGVAAGLLAAGCGGDGTRSPGGPAANGSVCAVEEPPLVRSGGGTLVGGFTQGAFCREYVLHLPPSYDGTRPVPLVVALHGYTGTAQGLEASSGLSLTADARGFIVVYPAGVQNAWDMTQGGRDASFLRELVSRLSARGNIDRRRIFVTGFSMGGGMANRAACDLADVFAAAAPVSGSYQWHELCAPRRPMPIFSVHGAADTTVPLVAPSGFSIADTWLAGWAGRNGCSQPPRVTDLGGVVETRYLGCAANADLRLLIVGGLGHTWWAPANDEIADFFEAHPFPG